MEYGLYFLEVVVQGPIIILNCFECSWELIEGSGCFGSLRTNNTSGSSWTLLGIILGTIRGEGASSQFA